MPAYFARNIKNYGQTLLPYHVALVVFITATVGGTYKELNFLTNNMGPLTLTKIAMPTSNATMDLEVFGRKYLDYIVKLGVESPLTYVHHSMPFAKDWPILLSGEGLTAVFEVPDAHELINLEKESIYTPSLLIPVEQQIDLSNLNNINYLISNIYSFHAEFSGLATKVMELWDFEQLASQKLTIDTNGKGPQVLIFHTHASSESFVGGLSIVELGEVLAQLIEDVLGLEVLHVTNVFDSPSRTGAYDRMDPIMQNIVDQNPTIQFAIDLHRDAVSGDTHIVGDLNGEDTAKIMFVNGITMRPNANDELVSLQYLPNNYLKENLAFSLQMYLQGKTYYPDIMRKIYLMPYRYSTHMVPYSLLVEVGFQTNTGDEAINALEPIVNMLANVFDLN
ncbi:MAG: hypothetical protein ATN36_04715 [Epulopiscium sp. Nele67-Bin005]|nr:MAG: hypothetical protein ATN36_04715 [Epulopiscium sp. Nele67-Bin005]